jgi:dephospho-CoA kinase
VALLVGLTGGIGTGKSLAASFFKESGAYIIDADFLSRELVQPGQPALKEIVNHFGETILDSNGFLDRKQLAQKVFQDLKEKVFLEGVLHPKIFEIEQSKYLSICAKDPSAVVIIDAALLIESGNYKHVDKVIVVRSDEQSQIQRIMSRSGLSVEEVESRINNQMSGEEKIEYADYILDNYSDRERLKQIVIEVYKELSKLSKSS